MGFVCVASDYWFVVWLLLCGVGFPVTRGFWYCLWVALRSSWDVLVSAYLFVLGSFWVGSGYPCDTVCFGVVDYWGF